MSMKAIGWAYHQDEKPGPKSVLLCLAWHADKTTWCSFPGVALMVRETGWRERAVAQHLDTLEKRGLIRRERRHVDSGPGKGKRLSDVFQLLGPGVDQTANLAGELSANSADGDNETTRKIGKDDPQISPTLPADSASAYIRIEPSTEPSFEPSLLPRHDEQELARKNIVADTEFLFAIMGYRPEDHPELLRNFLLEWGVRREGWPLDILEDVCRHARRSGRPKKPAKTFKWFMEYAKANATDLGLTFNSE